VGTAVPGRAAIPGKALAIPGKALAVPGKALVVPGKALAVPARTVLAQAARPILVATGTATLAVTVPVATAIRRGGGLRSDRHGMIPPGQAVGQADRVSRPAGRVLVRSRGVPRDRGRT
jgi:hypothetical protein